MWQPTAELIEEIQSGEYIFAWFIDFTEAFNKIHQPLLIDELYRRTQAWKMAQHLDYPADLSDLKGERKKEPVPEGN